jgi:hypothetical protein
MTDLLVRKNTFFTDVHIATEAIEVAIANGADIVTAFEMGMERDADSVLIEFALVQGLVMVTANRKDFDKHYYALSAQMIEHPGLIIVGADHHKSHHHIGMMLALYADEPLTNRVEWI